MLKCVPPMLNIEVCRVTTDKHKNKHTYRVKTEVTFFTLKFFFFFSDTVKSKKGAFQQNSKARGRISKQAGERKNRKWGKENLGKGKKKKREMGGKKRGRDEK